jgi:hypothetical protein
LGNAEGAQNLGRASDERVRTRVRVIVGETLKRGESLRKADDAGNRIAARSHETARWTNHEAEGAKPMRREGFEINFERQVNRKRGGRRAAMRVRQFTIYRKL